MTNKDFNINFDSGKFINRNGLFEKNGKALYSFDRERENFKFEDRVNGKLFLIEVVFRGAIIVFLYPDDLLKLGYETPIKKLEEGAKNLRKWIEKNGLLYDPSGEEIEVLFDPRSYMVHAAIQLA